MKKIAMILAILLLLSGCGTRGPEVRTLTAMDATMDMTLWGEDRAAAADALEELIRKLDKRWSVRYTSSIPYQMNDDGTVLYIEEMAFIDQVEALSKRTEGAFDPMLHSVIQLWGFQDGNHRVPAPEELESALAEEKWNLGAVVKGYTGRRAVELLQTMGVERAILHLGANVQTYGENEKGKPWIIPIPNPETGKAAASVAVKGTWALATARDTERYFEQSGQRYHDILDPKTGMPAESGLASVTVICKDGVVADALATALYVMGLEAATEFWRSSDDFEAVFIGRDGKIYATEGVSLSDCQFQVIRREA